jgi:hypothetical protein
VIRLRFALSLIAAAAMATTAAYASGTTAWEMNSWADFIRGKFEGISLSRDGRITLGPKMDAVFTSDQPVVWAAAEGTDGAIYAATGNRGRVYKIDRAGNSSLYWTAPEPEVFAITAGGDGAVYAGTSPDGKVYRIEKGVATEYFAPHARYIWALAIAPGPRGALYVGTGDQGKVFRVESAGKGETYYETGQSHITGLAIDSQGRLLAGTEPNGILYRITAKDKAFVLYDANLPEIRAIVPMPDGTVYAAALGGSVAKQAQAAVQATQNTNVVTAPGTQITVSVDAAAQNAAEIKPQDIKPQQPVAATPQVTSSFSAVGDSNNVEKSAVYRINPDNTVETLWSSKEENAYDLLALEKQILFSTDQDGRIYGLSSDRRVTLVAQTNESETLRLLAADHSILAATGNMGRIFRLGETAGASGTYEAPVHDSGTASKWGSMSWRVDLPSGSKIAFRTRSGNSAKPDRTWSEWSAPLTEANGSRIASPNARFIQWKLEMTGASGATPVLNSVSLAYLPQNSPPALKSINVVSQAVPQRAQPAPSSSAAYSVTVTDSGDASANSTGTSTQTLQRAYTQQITIAWQADDPDGDRLLYNVYFRGADEMQWKVLKSATHEASLTFDADVLADGKYYFRVIASDRESNPPGTAREAILDSAPVMIDNTPPLVTANLLRYTNGAAHIEWEAVDGASGLRRCEYSLDAGDWIPVEAADGVIDSLREKFSLDLSDLKPGEHLVAIRVSDSANNTGLAKVVLK